MFSKNNQTLSPLSDNKKERCCPSLCQGARRLKRGREVALTGLSFMASFGPRRYRLHCQQLLAVISVLTAATQFFRSKQK